MSQPNNVSAAGVLTDEQKLNREQLNLIAVCNPDLLLMHIEQDTNYDAKLLARVFDLAKQQARTLLAAASAQATGKPVAWIRYRSDGCFEGPIMDSDSRMCDTRRSFWTPLYAAPSPAARGAGDGVSDSESLHAFLDAAAGEGLVLNGIDAADLYIRLFPERYAAALSAQPAKE